MTRTVGLALRRGGLTMQLTFVADGVGITILIAERHSRLGAHTVNLCQMALGTDGTTPLTYETQPDGNTIHAE